MDFIDVFINWVVVVLVKWDPPVIIFELLLFTELCIILKFELLIIELALK